MTSLCLVASQCMNGMTMEQLLTFLSNSVVAAMDDPRFGEGLERLKRMGQTGARLTTFMSDSVASALVNNPGLFLGITIVVQAL
jgi:hypothetical protein